MAIDRARDERERVAKSLPLDDLRGLLADRQSTGHPLLLDLKLEHDQVSRHRGALPSAIPHVSRVLAGSQREGVARGASRERHVEGRRNRVTGRIDGQIRRECQSALHLDTSMFRIRHGATVLAQQYAPASQRGWLIV
jgi:hypothetical protein